MTLICICWIIGFYPSYASREWCDGKKKANSFIYGEIYDELFLSTKVSKGYMLEIGGYVLNSVSTKSIPNTGVKLLTSSKVSIQHYRIWRCLAYMFKGKIGKLDTKSELCYFVGYPKGIKY